MIEFVKGDFFNYDADIRINTVNCVGIMGAGVALVFKEKYPAMYKDYVKQCQKGQILPGKPTTWVEGGLFSKIVTIINFPTKDHWRKPSKYEYIESGLKWLAQFLVEKKDQVVVMPALGCGHGGLDWAIVKEMIQSQLANTPAKILVFEPSSSKNARSDVCTSYESNQRLKNAHIFKLERKSSNCPNGLGFLSERSLYTYPEDNIHLNFDIALIISTKPNEFEKFILKRFLEFCLLKNLSIVLGASAFEKELAIEGNKYGLRVGVFLPSGIHETALRLEATDKSKKITLLSFGNPFKPFERKEYLPSVLGRMLISDSVVFFTPSLDWVLKQEETILRNRVNSFFVRYSNLSPLSLKAMENIGASALAIDEKTNWPNFNKITE